MDFENKKEQKVLAIDDSQTNLALLRAHLQKMGITVFTAQNAKEGIEIANKEIPDLILLDVMMPEINGFEACKTLKEDSRTMNIPVIFISANDQPCDKTSGLKLGAIDYIAKPFDPGELKARINTVLQMNWLQNKLLAMANTDELTGLHNRRYFFNILEREILHAKIKGDHLAILMIDVDHFKNVNDNYGHLAGDTILRQLARILQENAYPLDVIARYGGEEFIILMPSTRIDQAANAAERFRKVVDEHYWKIGDKKIAVTLSIGVAAFDSLNCPDMTEFIKKADNSLYSAKEQGRNCVACWDYISPSNNNHVQHNLEYIELQNKVSFLAKQLRAQALKTVYALTKAILIKDPYMAQHAKNVAIYTFSIAEQMYLSEELKEKLITAAKLHDLGKILISNHILKKTAGLTENEQSILNKHPVISAEIISPIGLFPHETQIIKHHHENFDGTGFPNGLKGREIPIGSRIIAAANIFDAITYHPYDCCQTSYEEGFRVLTELAGKQLDPDIIEAMKKAYQKNGDKWPLSKKVPVTV